MTLVIGSLKQMHGLDESSKVPLQSMMQKSELESSLCCCVVLSLGQFLFAFVFDSILFYESREE